MNQKILLLCLLTLSLTLSCSGPDVLPAPDIQLEPEGGKEEPTDPENPDPEQPDPEQPDPEKPDPEQPDPEKPQPEPEPQPQPEPQQPQWTSGTYFAPGVSQQKGWYDVNKKRDGLSDGDFLLCWAASAANMLQWWQDYYQAHGYSLPSTALNGAGSYYELAIFEAMKANYENRGCSTNYAIHWYFTGEDRGAHITNYPHPKPGSGGYFQSVFSSLVQEIGGSDLYCQEINSYDAWGGGSSDNRLPLVIFSELLQQHLRQGAMGMTLRTGFSALHDVTLWGCDVDAQGLVTAVWITDSDDLMSKPSAPRVQKIHRLPVVGDMSGISLTQHFTGQPKVTGLTTLRAYPAIP